MNILKYLDKDSLHHAYLVEGEKEEVVPEIISFLNGIGIKTSGNADFSHLSTDSFKIEDARNLKSFSTEKSVFAGKRIFLISTNNFLLEAQNTLLKMFEEPIENTHFFLVVPDAGVLLKTFISRFYLISTKQKGEKEIKEAKNFIALPIQKRIDFLKGLLVEEESEDENGEEMAILNSGRSKALRFLNSLEMTIVSRTVLDNNMSRTVLDSFEHFFKVRKYLSQPGSSAKNLMESVALLVPNFKN